MLYKEAVKSKPVIEKTQSSLMNLADPDKIKNLKGEPDESNKKTSYGWKQ